MSPTPPRAPTAAAARPPRRVVELATGFGPAMLAAKLLADQGAHVVKLEPRAGDPLRAQAARRGESLPLHDLLCGSKDSVAMELDAPHAREALTALLADTDVLVCDHAGWRRLGLLFAEGVASAFPGLVCAVCTPFGLGHAWSGWQAGEEGLQALSGIMATTGHPGERPVRVAGAIVTHAAAMFAVTSALAHLHGRARAGAARGAVLDLAMFDAAVSLLTSAFPAYFLSGQSPRGLGNRHSMAAPWNTFRCRDGWVVVCAGNEPTWLRLVAAIGRPDLLQDPDYATQEARVAHVDALDAQVTRWTASRSTAEVEAALDAQGVPSGPILPLRAVLRHPQFVERAGLHRDAHGAIAGGVFHRDGQPQRVVRASGHALGAATRDVFQRRLATAAARYEQWLASGTLTESVQEVGHAVAA